MMQETSLQPGWISQEQWETFTKSKTTAHRIFSTPPVWIERFGNDILITRTIHLALEELLEELELWSKQVGFSYKRIFRRDLVKNPNEEDTNPVIFGPDDLPHTTTVMEDGIKYNVDFECGCSQGFFIDQRINRERLRKLSPKTVLNCFAYTCSFSVVSAIAGAVTTSVDISKKHLQRGKENFTLNNLNPEDHSFMVDDVRKVLARFARKKHMFDAIVIDPPTFSRPKMGKPFQVEKEFPEMIEHALKCLNPNGHLLLSTNYKKLSISNLMDETRLILRKMNKKARFHTEDTADDVPEWAMPGTTWITLES